MTCCPLSEILEETFYKISDKHILYRISIEKVILTGFLQENSVLVWEDIPVIKR